MPDSGVIKEFLVGLGYKVDEGSQRRFTAGIKDASVNTATLNKLLAQTSKAFTELGERYGKLAGQPVRDYQEQTRKIIRSHEDLAKSFTNLARVAVTAGTGILAAMRHTANEYADLFYAAQRIGTTVGGLKDFQFGFQQIGISIEQATASLDEFAQKMKLPGAQAVFANIVRPEDFAAIKQEFGDLFDNMSETEKKYKAALQAIVRIRDQLGRPAAIAYANLLGLDIQLAEQFQRNIKAEVEGERWAAEEAKKLGVTREELARRAVEQQREWNKAILALGTAWQQAFIEISPKLIWLLDKLIGLVHALDDFNRNVPGAAAAEGFIAMGVGASVLLGTLGRLIAPLIGIARGLRLIAPAAAGATVALDTAGAAAAAAAASASKGVGAFRGLINTLMLFGAAQQAIKATPEELTPGSPAARKKEQDITKSLDETTGGWFSTLFGLPQRLRDQLLAPVEPPAGAGPLGGPRRQRAPTDYDQAPARYQGGGIVRIDAHDQEMVLPPNISRGLQALFAYDKPRMLGAPDSEQAAKRLADWLRGAAGLIPRVIIENVDDFIREQQMARDGAAGGAGDTLGGRAGRFAGRLGGMRVPTIGKPTGEQGADLDLLEKTIYELETASGKNITTSAAGARGPMQITPDTWKEYARPGENIDNPEQNRQVGRRIIESLYQKYAGDLDKVLVAYNAGPGRVGQTPLPAETQAYLRKAHAMWGTPNAAAATGVNPYLHAAMSSVMKPISQGGVLPEGFSAMMTSGLRPGEQGSQHFSGGAEDWQITDAQGRPVRSRGEDTTGLYQKAAVAAIVAMQKINPRLARLMAWGGHFGTALGGGGEADLMHYDIGGPRGRIGDYMAEQNEAAARIARASAQLDRISQQAPLTSRDAPNGNGGVTNNTEGDRSVTINQTNNTNINGADGNGSLYRRTHERIHGDLLRNARTALA